jgi:hypothetical protein
MEVVSVWVASTNDEQARVVGPLVAKELYPDLRLGKAVHSEPLALENGMQGTEVLVEVDPLITPLSGAIRAEDRPRATTIRQDKRGQFHDD